MKILQLIDTLTVGGAERMAVNISNVLANNGHEVTLCATHSGGSLVQFVDRKVRLIELGKRNAMDIVAFIRLLKLTRRDRIELIHAHSSSIFWAVAAKLITPGIKVIWHDHLGKRIEEEKFNRIIIIISFLIDGVIAVNDELKNWSSKKLLVKKEKIVFINNFPLLSPCKKEKHKKDKGLQIVCMANLRPQKDHITLVKSIHWIRSEYPMQNIKVIFAGLFNEDIYFKNIVKQIEEYNLQNIIKVLGPVEDTATFLASSDIGVLSSVSEGLPVSLLEYGLAGLPVVVTNVGQCAEVVDFGNAGLVVPPSDPQALAAALLDLIQHPEKRALLGSKLKERVENEYGARKFLIEYNKLIESLSKNDK